MKLYKITDKNGYSGRKCLSSLTLWGRNVTHQVKWSGEMCQRGCLHAYKGPYSAAMFASAHDVEFLDKKLWEAKGKVHLDDGTKVGCKKLTTIREVDIPPKPTRTQSIAFSILCALETPKAKENKEQQEWAQSWLSGKDRSAKTARKATISSLPFFSTVSAARNAYKECNGQIDIEALAKKAITEF